MTKRSHGVPLFLYHVGTPLAHAAEVVADFLYMAKDVLISVPKALKSPGVIIERFQSLVISSWFLVVITSFATGAAMALQFGQGMSRFGGKLYVPNIIAFAIVRALGPVFACLMVAARSGGGVAAELGSMKITQQIDALRALGTKPEEKLVAPIVIALVCGMPFLTFLADIAGIAGGLLVSISSLGIAPSLYIEKTMNAVPFDDLLFSLAKTSIFGGVIGLISCFMGMRTQTGTSGIGIATTTAIVVANIFVLVGDFFITKLQWMLQW
ncbi:MAG TPA: ABC transporter permease [Oligoflexus sp.]|uniref:MlaE family ABC transporter permease n=1 Tax=Oligoflexus sp. TaxID=1971216 RepID=UPI002D80D656|nr:ABC transporter permease [Oligoflexus sp.]HET9236832.1 ABC transporter permease [Oligoflexus sp.]